jgi:hypothetical protein
MRLLIAFASFALLAAAPAQAKELKFTAALGGDKAPTQTGSKATGQALIVVDTDRQTVGMTLDVKGFGVDGLWTNLLKTPMGPIHLHVYGSHDHSNPDSAQLMFPAPYGPSYEKTAAGFRVESKDVAYDTGARLVNSRASFDEFVGALEAGRIVLNIHTNRFTDGEISGDVVPAA